MYDKSLKLMGKKYRWEVYLLGFADKETLTKRWKEKESSVEFE